MNINKVIAKTMPSIMREVRLLLDKNAAPMKIASMITIGIGRKRRKKRGLKRNRMMAGTGKAISLGIGCSVASKL